uniref:Uncharacterized protein n=1 Tax=Knipowitschia caucasica TaxID=637954 RepID=A0AAV2L0P4_KNICA
MTDLGHVCGSDMRPSDPSQLITHYTNILLMKACNFVNTTTGHVLSNEPNLPFSPVPGPSHRSQALLTDPRPFSPVPGPSHRSQALLTGPRPFSPVPGPSHRSQALLTGPRPFSPVPGPSHRSQALLTDPRPFSGREQWG